MFQWLDVGQNDLWLSIQDESPLTGYGLHDPQGVALSTGSFHARVEKSLPLSGGHIVMAGRVRVTCSQKYEIHSALESRSLAIPYQD